MLPVSLDCYFSLPFRYSLTFICPVSCPPKVVSGLSFFLLPLRYSLRFILCLVYPMLPVSLDCPCSPVGILQHLFVMCLLYPMLPVSLDCPFSLPLRYSLTFICPVSCVPYVASFSGLSFFITPSVFSNMYLSCVLCTLCCQFLWIVLFYYPFGIL